MESAGIVNVSDPTDQVTNEISALQIQLSHLDQKLIESTVHLAQCGSPKNDDVSDDEDDVGDTNSPWSEYIMKLASSIDALRQTRCDVANRLMALGVSVQPIDDGY